MRTDLARCNADLLKVFAAAGSPRTSFADREALLAEVAAIEARLEEALSLCAIVRDDQNSISEKTPWFDEWAAVDTTRDLVVRAKVAVTTIPSGYTSADLARLAFKPS